MYINIGDQLQTRKLQKVRIKEHKVLCLLFF